MGQSGGLLVNQVVGRLVIGQLTRLAFWMFGSLVV